MTGTESDLRELVTRLSRQVIEDHLRNLRSHNEVRQLVARGLVDQRVVDEAYWAYAREEGERYRRRIADLSVRYYGELLELGNEWSERFYARLLGAVHPNGDGAAPPVPVPVELTGAIGGYAETRFQLSNDRDVPVGIGFLVGPFQGPGGEPFRPIVTLHPPTLDLPPGGTGSVTLRVLLEPGLFEVGRIYTSTVEVVGHPGVALALSVWATSPAPDVRVWPPPTADLRVEPTEAGASGAAPAREGAHGGEPVTGPATRPAAGPATEPTTGPARSAPDPPPPEAAAGPAAGPAPDPQPPARKRATPAPRRAARRPSAGTPRRGSRGSAAP